MKPDQIREGAVYDYKARPGNWPCVLVEQIDGGRVLFRWLEEEGGHDAISLARFAARCTSERDPQTWAPVPEPLPA